MEEWSTPVNPGHTQSPQAKGTVQDRALWEPPWSKHVGRPEWLWKATWMEGLELGSAKQQGAQVMGAGLAFSSLVCKLWTSWAQQVGIRVGGITICFSTLIFCLLSVVEDLFGWSLRNWAWEAVASILWNSSLCKAHCLSHCIPTSHFFALPASQFSSSTK